MFKTIVGEVSGTSRLEVGLGQALEFPVDHKMYQGVERELREQARAPGNAGSFFYSPRADAELHMPHCEQFVEELHYVQHTGRRYAIDGVGFSLRLEFPPAMQVAREPFDAEKNWAMGMGQVELDSRLDLDEAVWRLWANLYSSELQLDLTAGSPDQRFREYAGHVVLQANEIATPRTSLILPRRRHESRLEKPAGADQDEAAQHRIFKAFYAVAVCAKPGSYEVAAGQTGRFWASWHHVDGGHEEAA